MRLYGTPYTEGMKVPKIEDGYNKGLRLTEKTQSVVAALESGKNPARHFEQRISACVVLYCLHYSDSLASWIVP